MASVAKISAEHGSVAAHSPSALKDAGGEALQAGDVARATHMYTLGIDLILKGEVKPPASAAEWFALEAKSGGVLSALLSNRSLTLLKQEDAQAAAADAEHCTCAKPDWAKGHLRLLAALDACAAPLEERRRTCARALRACPGDRSLLEAKAALLDAGQLTEEVPSGGAVTDDEAAACAEQIAATRRIAADPADPRRAMAAGDYGSALALGAFGLQKNIAKAEAYLRLGSDGGDAGAQRNLGLLLLELDRAPEAAELLRLAADQGDEQATLTLDQLRNEAKAREEAALFKLRALASQGDPRAHMMLEQFEAERAVLAGIVV